jgi:hypothetical protein
MARILITPEGRWYEELRSVAYYSESEVEKRIIQHAKSLFPNHYVFRFKRDIVHRGTENKKRPDLALIRHDLSAWAIVEVESGQHGLDHVLSQTRVFINGDYNAPEVAEYVQKQLNTSCDKLVSLERLTKLFLTEAPSIFVVADTPETGWLKDLNEEGVSLCVFQIYKSVRGLYLYRTVGQYPTIEVKEAHCRLLASSPNLLEIFGDFVIKRFARGKVVEIVYEGYLTRWKLITGEGKQYLQFAGTSNPLSPAATYRLFRDRTHKYYLGRS